MCKETFVAVKKSVRQQGVRSSFGRAVSFLFGHKIVTMLFIPFREHGLMQRATFHFYCDIGNLAILVTFACDTCVWRLL